MRFVTLLLMLGSLTLLAHAGATLPDTLIGCTLALIWALYDIDERGGSGK